MNTAHREILQLIQQALQLGKLWLNSKATPEDWDQYVLCIQKIKKYPLENRVNILVGQKMEDLPDPKEYQNRGFRSWFEKMLFPSEDVRGDFGNTSLSEAQRKEYIKKMNLRLEAIHYYFKNNQF